MGSEITNVTYTASMPPVTDSGTSATAVDETEVRNAVYCNIAKTFVLELLNRKSDSDSMTSMNLYTIMSELDKNTGIHCNSMDTCRKLLQSIDGIRHEPYTDTYYRESTREKLSTTLNSMARGAQQQRTQKIINSINTQVIQAARQGLQMVKVWEFPQQPPTNDTAITEFEQSLVMYIQNVLRLKAWIQICTDSNVKYKEYSIITQTGQESAALVSDLPAYSEIRKSLFVQLTLDCFKPVQKKDEEGKKS